MIEEKNKTPHDMPTALDCAIREHEKKEGGYESGYKVKRAQYFNYICNEDWNKFLRIMNERHRKQYEMGAGGELKEGEFPPKMASFGSSSRLIYELSKDIDGFNFEEQLDTQVGGKANIDGFLHRGSNYIYIEAKRREIYYSSHDNEISIVYEPVYDAIKIATKNSFDFSSKKCTSKKSKKEFTFKVNSEVVEYFDLKQLISHFLGIAYDIAKHSISEINVKFLYLLYNPAEVKEEIDKKYHDEVMKRYDEAVEFIGDNIKLFESIFQAVFDYQVVKHNLKKPKINFKFKLVDQKEYIAEIK